MAEQRGSLRMASQLKAEPVTAVPSTVMKVGEGAVICIQPPAFSLGQSPKGQPVVPFNFTSNRVGG